MALDVYESILWWTSAPIKYNNDAKPKYNCHTNELFWLITQKELEQY